VEERTKALRNLISLASEVFLLTNKLKYGGPGITNKKG
jgi:chromosome segregation ATPase